MADETEQIEAKLSAFLDGELTPPERAEIEAHLAAHPMHRRLLNDLANTRDWVRALPRASAPADVLDAFQGQLERAALLGDAEVSPQRDVRHSRVPQIVSVAAVLLLAAGLGTVTYLVVSGGARLHAPKFSRMTTPTQPVLPPMAGSVPFAALLPPTSEPAANVDTIAAMPPSTSQQQSLAMATPVPVPTLEQQAANSALARPRAMKAANEPVPAAAEVERPTLFVYAANPAAADASVLGFLQRNGIGYSTRQTGMAADDLIARQDLPMNGGMARPATSLPATTQAMLDVSAELADAGPKDRLDAAPTPTAAPSPATQRAADLAAGQTVYEVAALTDDQKADLQATLSHDVADGRIVAAGDWANAGPALQAGDQLRVTVQELVGPGVEKANAVTVQADGTIRLPMIDPVAAAGLTTGRLREAVATRYQQSNLIAAPTVTVALAGPNMPTTSPITQAAMATSQPAGRVASDPRVAIVVSHRPEPAGATTAPSSQP